MTTFIFVRHAHSVNNVTRTYNANPANDKGLDGKGKKQAALLAKKLAREKIHVIYSSPFPRCIETVQAVAKQHKLKIIQDERLSEHRVGHWEGMPKAEVLKRFHEEKASQLADRLNYVIPGGGENYKQIMARALDFVNEKAREHEGKTVLIATHDAVIRSALAAALGDVEWLEHGRGFVENASTTAIEFSDGKCKLKEFNDVSHLKELEESAHA